MCCRWCAKFYFGAFALIIILEVTASVLASTAAAFSSATFNPWGLVIFVANSGFVSFLTYYVCKELFWDETEDFTLNWICGMCTVFTGIVFLALYFLTKPPLEIVGIAFGVYLLALFMLASVACCFNYFLQRGYDDAIRSSHNSPKRSKPIPTKPRPDEQKGNQQGKILEQSLTQIINHVESTPDPNSTSILCIELALEYLPKTQNANSEV